MPVTNAQDMAKAGSLINSDGTTVSVAADLLIADKLVHTGDTNTAIRFPAADTVTVETSGTERMRIDSNGRVGIGTSSPSYPMDIVADSNAFALNLRGRSVDNLGYIRFSTNNGATNHAAVGTPAVNTLALDTNSTERLRIDSSGNVGIGTASPQNILHISSSGPVIRIQDNDTVGNGTNSIATWFSFRDSAGSQTGYFGFPSDPNFYIWNQTNSAMVFGTNHIERLRIDSSGNVGIGTTSPSGRLSVSSGSAAQYASFNSNAANGGYLTIESSGTVHGDIGTAAQVVSGGSTSDFGINARGSRNLVLGTNNTERLRITSGGFLKASNNGSYLGIGSSYHEMVSSDISQNLVCYASSGSFVGNCLDIWLNRNTTNNTFYAIGYYNQATTAYRFRVADSGNVTNTNNSYGAISDIKIKQDIVDASSQWSDIKSLRVRKYRFKSDPSMPLQLGLVAQEAETVSAGLIEEHPDYEDVEITNEDGTITKERKATGTSTKAIKYSVLYMKAVKALQEAMGRIEQLESKVAALEAA